METQLIMNIPGLSNSGHAYLDELGDDARPYSALYPEDSRQARWAEQRKIYGFDDSETWGLESAFYAWLYEHLRMYVDIGGQVVDFHFHKFEWKTEEYYQDELIDMILERIRFYFSDDYDAFDAKHNLYLYEIGELWALVLPAMWW